MYEEQVQRLRETSMDFGEADHVSVMLLEAANAIEELSNSGSIYGKAWTLGYDTGRAENSPHWIPMTEKLPDEGKFVLVYGDLYPNKHDGGVIAVSKRMDWNYWQGFGRERNITHWMPLPEPPKEEI